MILEGKYFKALYNDVEFWLEEDNLFVKVV